MAHKGGGVDISVALSIAEMRNQVICWNCRGFGHAVSISARKLKIVPQSSAEAEYAAYSIAVRDLKFVSQILGSDGFQLLIGKPLTCYSDNTAAIDTIKQVGVNARNRHYDRWLHFGREMWLEKFCLPDWVSTHLPQLSRRAPESQLRRLPARDVRDDPLIRSC